MAAPINSIGLYLMHQIPLTEQLYVVNNDLKDKVIRLQFSSEVIVLPAE